LPFTEPTPNNQIFQQLSPQFKKMKVECPIIMQTVHPDTTAFVNHWVPTFKITKDRPFVTLSQNGKVTYAGSPGFELQRKLGRFICEKPDEYIEDVNLRDEKYIEFKFPATLDESKIVRGKYFNPVDQDVVVIKFSATWCKPCLAVEPLLMKLHKKTPAVNIIEVFNQEKAAIDKVLLPIEKQLKSTINHTIITLGEDFTDQYFKEFDIKGIPHCLILEQGKCVFSGHPGDGEFTATVISLQNKYGEPIPELNLKNSDFSIPIDVQTAICGTSFDPSTHQGPVLYEFSRTFCGPCIQFLPTLTQHAKEFSNIKFLSIWADPAPKVKKVVNDVEAKHKISLSELNLIAVDESSVEPYYDALQIQGIPFCCLTDEGRIVFSGHPASPDLLSHLKTLNKKYA
jgi:thiol-disulfide isomerase/thioredoxin